MHARKIVHRDIKPENILIVGERAKLGDFGTVKTLEESDPDMSYRVGTTAYFAPEKK